MKDSKIEWTHHTFNPWWGCVKVSPGCTHCYAETFSKRTGHDVWGANADRRVFGNKHWNEPYKWDEAAGKAGTRSRVFCASMADVFEDRRDLDVERRRLWNVIETTPNLDWLLLTKRPENITRMIDQRWMELPCANVWFGTTCENQEQAEKRIPELLKVPAAVRFLSCEPLLGPVDLTLIPDAFYDAGMPFEWQKLRGTGDPRGIHWVIAGGESGPGARPMHPDWARSLRNQCVAAGVPFHFKQWGEHRPVFESDWAAKGQTFYERVGKKAAGRLLDGVEWNEFPQVAVPA